MNSILKKSTLIIIISILFFASCRTEETELITTPDEEQLLKNSEVAVLIQKTSTNDGSIDNIIDKANCFTIQLPVTVTVNGNELEITTIEDYLLIETIFDEFDDDADSLQIQFPITVILADYTETIINSLDELNTLSNTCNSENEADFDIECIDFQYPISVSVFNPITEIFDTLTFNEDSELLAFVENIDINDIITIDFPITLIIFDGSTITVNNLLELEEEINTYSDQCDEDDDNDYNDDDCNDCTDNQISTFIMACPEWSVDKLELNDNDLEDNYVGYSFTFNVDNTISVINAADTFLGTWSADGTGNNITVTINIPTLTDFNNNWILHEIEQEVGEFKFDLRLGDDRLRFESNCDTATNSIISVSSPSAIEGIDLVHNVVVSNATTIETYTFLISNNTTSDNDYNQITVFSNGVTYNDVTGLISVPAGISNFTVTITTIDDSEVESTEFYNITIGTINATGTITDNDTATNSIISVSSPSAIEGIDLVHNVVVSNATTIETYTFLISNNTTSDNDYNQITVFSNGVTYNDVTGLISVPAGISNFTVTITTIDDAEVESTEFYNITIGTINATGTITDNDTATPLTLSEILADGLWIVSTYLDNGVNETGDYTGYQLNFDSSGTVLADNGTPINGTWSVQNADTELTLDFGINIPFDELNDDWDVISITETQIELEDVSGGGGGTDTLIFTKL